LQYFSEVSDIQPTHTPPDRMDSLRLIMGFSKDVCNLFCGWNVMNLNNLIGDLLSQKMVFYGDVLGLGMKYWILGPVHLQLQLCPL
jgi:hypothetical protein